MTSEVVPSISDELIDLLESSDVVSVNLEGPICTPTTSRALKVGPVVRQASSVMPFMKAIGVTHVCLANNHIMDFGSEGLSQSLHELKDLGVLGAGLSVEDAYREHRIHTATATIALLAFGEAQFGVLDETAIHNKCAGFAWVDSPRARQAIIKAREETSLVIVQVHAGLEMVDMPLPEWRACYRELVDLGADIVIGHHPHVLQGAEKYREGMIFYSLGNFHMDFLLDADPKPGWPTGGALEVLIDPNNIEDVTTRLIPLRSTKKEISIDFSEAVRDRYDALCLDLASEFRYLERISEICEVFLTSTYSKYYEFALMGLGTNPSFSSLLIIARRILSKYIKRSDIRLDNEMMLIHNLRIETHRWVVQRALLNRRSKRN